MQDGETLTRMALGFKRPRTIRMALEALAPAAFPRPWHPKRRHYQPAENAGATPWGLPTALQGGALLELEFTTTA